MLKREDLFIEKNMVLNAQETITADEIITYLNKVEYATGIDVKISKRSGIRTIEYEKRKGRKGTSQHSTYHIVGRGAVDLIYTKELLDYLLADNFFTRVCYYPKNGFIHVDRKPINKSGVKYYEASSPTATWVLKKYLP
jgi:uncharacterized protein YcbK (DUF882 family)